MHIPVQTLIKKFKSCLLKHKSYQKKGFERGAENILNIKKSTILPALKTDVI